MGPAVHYLQLGAVWKRDVTNLQKLKRNEGILCFFWDSFWNEVSKHRAIIIDSLPV